MTEEFTPHLKELSGRLLKLSYREMIDLSNLIQRKLPSRAALPEDLVLALLDAADKIGGSK